MSITTTASSAGIHPEVTRPEVTPMTGRPGPTCKIEEITPDLAKQWLGANHINRRLIDSNVARLSAAMIRGEWMEDSTDGIGLDVDGSVVNGQHRLKAIVDSGVPVRALVVRNVRPEVIRVIDQGMPRNLTQILQIDGRYMYAQDLAGAIKWLWQIANDFEQNLPRGATPSVQQLLDFFVLHPHLTDSVKVAVAVTKPFKGLHKGYTAALHYMMATVDPDDADDFFEKLESGVEISNGEPVHALREKLLYNMGQPEAKQAKPLPIAAWVVKAWEAHREGRSLTTKTLKWDPSGARGEDFPKVSNIMFAADGSFLDLIDEEEDVAEGIEEGADA